MGDRYASTGAELSDCDRYRYCLWRTWDFDAPTVVWIMLNPSTADAEADDATIRRCVGFARRWGCGGIHVVNLFAFRATHPRELWAAESPIGPRNDGYIHRAVTMGDGPLVAAWGALPNGRGRPRVEAVAGAAFHAGRHLECLGRTKGGDPRHPVRLPGDTPLEPWSGA